MNQKIKNTDESLPDLETMNSHQRQLEIMSLQRRIHNGEKLTRTELQQGLLLIRANKNERTGKINGKKAVNKKPSVPQMSLSDF